MHDTESFSKLIRKSFVQMYKENDVLEQFRESLKVLGVETPSIPTKGTFDINVTLDATYSFA